MYGKLFEQLFDSSIMEERVETRLLFFCMVVLSDEDGNLDMTDTALARRVNMPLTTVSECLNALSSPDPDSRSPECDGRRIEPLRDIGYGWKVVNKRTYHSLASQGERRTYMRRYMREYRGGKQDVNRRKQSVNTPSVCVSVSASEEGEGSGEGVTGGAEYSDDFLEFWDAYPRKVGKLKAFSVWKKTKKIRPRSGDLLSHLDSLKRSGKWQQDGGQFIPHPATWLIRGGWEDEIENGKARSTQPNPHAPRIKGRMA